MWLDLPMAGNRSENKCVWKMIVSGMDKSKYSFLLLCMVLVSLGILYLLFVHAQKENCAATIDIRIVSLSRETHREKTGECWLITSTSASTGLMPKLLFANCFLCILHEPFNRLLKWTAWSVRSFMTSFIFTYIYSLFTSHLQCTCSPFASILKAAHAHRWAFLIQCG